MKQVPTGRKEFKGAILDLGGTPMDLSEYASTGLRVLAIGPSGCGKTNVGQLVAEQLSAQGWVSVIVDPEGEVAAQYGGAVEDPDELRTLLIERTQPIVVVHATEPSEFIDYGRVILEVGDRYRNPTVVVIDEGQLFSSSKKTSKENSDLGESVDILNQIAERGRKRSLDLCITALKFTGSLSRSLFNTKSLTLIGRQEDPTAWSSIAPLFRASKIQYADVSALSTGEFFLFSKTGVEKVRVPMAEALKRVASKAVVTQPKLPATFSQWDRAMRQIPDARLADLTPEMVSFLGAVAGLSGQQMASGTQALLDEREMRA
jgi:hypothetical protein